MVFGIKEKSIILIHAYNVLLAIATNTCATYDWFCGPGSHIEYLAVCHALILVIKYISHYNHLS